MTEDDDEKKKKDKDEKKAYKTQTEQQTRKEENLPYFQKVERRLENSRRLKQKTATEKTRVENMIKQKQQEIKNAKNKESQKLAQADCQFLKQAKAELPLLKMRISGDIAKLNLILATNIKMPYNVLIDFALKPLPSERAKNKDKDKNKDKNNDKGKDNENKSKDTPNKQKETPEQKTGRDLYSLSRKGKNRNLPQAKKPARRKTPQQLSNSQQKTLPVRGGRD